MAAICAAGERCAPPADCAEVEKAVHSALSASRLRGEWFAVSAAAAQATVDTILDRMVRAMSPEQQEEAIARANPRPPLPPPRTPKQKRKARADKAMAEYRRLMKI
jgi:hypothetical protein